MKNLIFTNICVLGFLHVAAAQRLVWECNNFPTDAPFDGDCNWERNDFNWGEGHVDTVQDPDGSSQDVARIFYPEGSYAGNGDGDAKGGAQFYARPFGSYNHVVLQYQVFFSDNFDFVLGGKLPGLFGGEGPCSGGNTAECFSVRFHWRADGDCELYAYIPLEEDDWFCDNEDVVCNFDFGHSFGRGSFRFQVGTWHTIAMDIRLNDPGQANAEMKILFDGSQVYDITGLNIRNDNSIMVDQLFFSTFFGGSSSTDYASAVDCHTHFRNFQVFTYDSQ